MIKRNAQLLAVLRKLLIALAIALLFALLAIFPQLGYFAKASVQVRERSSTGFWLVQVNANVSYNPFLFALSWLTGKGFFSDSFLWISVPTYAGGEFKAPVWRSSGELADEATVGLVLNEVLMNFPYNFIILLVIEVAKKRDFYFCLIAGILGFPFGGPVGAVIGFLVGLLVVVLLMPKLRRDDALVRFWESLWKTKEFPL